jgi:Flp pilus assembly protein TadG
MWRDYVRQFASSLCTALRDDHGSVAVYAAITLPILLGSVGLGVDVGAAYSARQSAQNQADAAAVAAALEIARGKNTDEAKAAATSDAQNNGFSGPHGDIMVVNTPPSSGPFTTDPKAVEVEISSPVQLHFVGMVGADSNVTVTARAVARTVRSEACVWSLEEIDTGVSLTGTADVNLSCGVYARSTSGSAIEQKGTSCLTATSVVTAGGAIGTCIHPTPRTNAAVLDDPLGALPTPTASSICDVDKKKITKDETLSPGVYCNGISVQGNAKVKFNPGLYTIRGGSFSASGSSELTGDGVTFFLTNQGADYATVNLTSTILKFTAPTSGVYKGILFFQDRNTPSTLVNKLAGNGAVTLTGLIYMPTTQLDFRGGSSGAAVQSFIVARKLRFVGNSYVAATGSSIQPSGLTTVSLVE